MGSVNFNYLREESTLSEQVAKVISYSQDIPLNLIKVDKIIEDWFNNKNKFIKLFFNNRLIYEVPEPITFTLDEDKKEVLRTQFIYYVESHFDNISLITYVNRLTVREIFNNLTEYEYTIEDITIPKGYKVSKSFKFFIKNDDVLKEIQTEISRVIQSNCVTGTLCFSVHPLDYLSVSENDCGWRSCHSLDGDFRSGNLNYMVDDCTFVCYLKTNKTAILPHFPDTVPWNSKIWRVLLYLSQDETMLFAGKPYPFLSNEGLDIVIKEFNKLRPDFTMKTNWISDTFSHFFTEDKKNEFYLDRMIPVGHILKKQEDVIKDAERTYQFNDLLRSSTWEAHWTYREVGYWFDTTGTGSSNDSTNLKVGKPCRCPICQSQYITFSDSMTCLDCNNEYHIREEEQECEICGNMTSVNDLYFLHFSEIFVCQRCYEQELYQCDICGISDLGSIIKYHEYDNQCLCPDCWAEKIQFKEKHRSEE